MTGELDQLGVALVVGAALEAAGAQWMIGGSVATSAYGEPRATHDVDLVSDLRISGVPPFVEALGDAFYVDADVVRDAARRRASFNVIHFLTTEKIDVFCTGERFAAHGLQHRRFLTLPDGRTAPVAAPEDMVVEKLRWFRRGGEVSDRQLRDVRGVLQVLGHTLDQVRMRRWAAEVGVSDLLERELEDGTPSD
ncbi:MAG: hypothetical protein H6732_09935 [Alphaproteobacteria bacterium]|nr:hypothetical protein [Alphaproteobacteria bacterium]